MKINNIIVALRNYNTRKEVHEGREYIVAPVVILTEGVHCGSAGCMLYRASELGKHPQSWNGIPLPVFHPTTPEGEPISANSPEVIEQESVGRLFGVDFKDNKLAGELWVDVNKAQLRHPEMLSKIRKGEPIEVSTGLWSDHVGDAGEWNGESYITEVINMKPDHLALLPGGRGACSVDDGCGVRVNIIDITNLSSKKGEKEFTADKSIVIDIIKALAKNQIAHEDVRMSLQREVDKRDVIRQEPGQSTFHFVLAVYDDFFVFRKESPEEVLLFKQKYSVSGNGEIEVGEEANEVREKISYIETNEDINDNDVNKKTEGGKTMCPDKVKALIENEDTKWTKEDEKFLLDLDDKMAEKMTEPVVITKEVPETNEARIAREVKELEAQKAEEDAEKEKGKKIEPELNAEDRMYLEHGKEKMKEEKEILMKAIGNSVFTDEELNKKDIAELNKLASLANVEVNYGPAGGNNASKVKLNRDDDEGMGLPDMEAAVVANYKEQGKEVTV